MTAEATLLDHADVEMQFNGNQNGRWMHCARCDLQLGCWPRAPFSGQYSAVHNPAIVDAALGLLRDHGNWETVDCEVMKEYIKLAQVNKKLRGKLDKQSEASSEPTTEAPTTPRRRGKSATRYGTPKRTPQQQQQASARAGSSPPSVG